MLNLNLLNVMQKEAVTTTKKKVFVVAGAGCGKTRVLTYRIAYLLDRGVPESKIFAFTFTNKAAHEMKSRLEDLLGYETDVSLSTFHAFAYKHLKVFYNVLGFKEEIRIIDEDEKIKIIKSILRSIDIKFDEDYISKEISNIKSLIGIKENKLKIRMSILKVYFTYQEMLKTSSLMDFDDLLYFFYELLSENENLQNWFKEDVHILVDECQDINKIQYEIIKLLGRRSKNIFMVGDEDQCIYSFRGSDPSCMRDFINEEKAEIIKLEQNYRSCQNILMAANSVIKNNTKRVDKRLYTSYNDKNYKLIISDFYSDYDEALYIADLIEELIIKGYNYRDFTILYRNNSVSIPIEKELLKRKIPFHIFGKVPFFRKPEVKKIIYYLRIILNRHDNIAFIETINYPKRGIGEYYFEQLKVHMIENGFSFYDGLMAADDLKEVEGFNKYLKLIEKFSAIINDCNLVTFVKELLNDLGYFELIRHDKHSKDKITNVYTFLDMIEQIEVINNNTESLSNFLSDIYLENTKYEPDKNYAKMMTIHQAKGLEYKIVILAGCNDGILPVKHEPTDILEEERRLFYVALTRAKERLYILSTKRRLINGQYKTYTISPFIKEISSSVINFN